jgi:hypothetical protein
MRNISASSGSTGAAGLRSSVRRRARTTAAAGPTFWTSLACAAPSPQARKHVCGPTGDHRPWHNCTANSAAGQGLSP